MPHLGRILKRLAVVGATASGGVLLAFGVYDIRQEVSFKERLLKVAHSDTIQSYNVRPTIPLPSRAELLQALSTTPEFDVLVIGGGATGAGVALDAQSRGLKTALVEMNDFSSGTSSRSTKLIHGGVRYLQAAVMKLDFEQYRMVKEALFERANLLEIAPHLSSPLPIMLPVYRWFDLAYYWCGIKAYDFVSGKRLLKPSYAIGKKKALELFPMLKKESLVGALIYYDGQHNDARMNLAIVLTAIRLGAKCANHVSVLELIKEADESGKVVVRGAKVRDEMSGNEFLVRAKSVINATGAFSDTIRQMDDPDARKLVVPSQGVHIVLPGYYSPKSTGLLDPSTSDGRVIFFLPWQDMTVAGTTDSPCEITTAPKPAEQDVEFILNEIRHYLSSNISVRRGDVLSAWAGLRPLVRDPSKKDTASLARNHIIDVSQSQLLTIAGGKWTTYRQMAEETVDKAISVCGLTPSGPCVTPGLLLEGAHEYDPLSYIKLVQDYGLEVDVAIHLAHSYGDRAFSVARLAKLTGKRWPLLGRRLHEEFPYLEAEVHYAIKEYATTAVDVIARRLRLAFLNTYAAEEALPRIVDIMAEELKWDKNEKKKQLDEAQMFIDDEMGKLAKVRAFQDAPLHLTKEEKDLAIQRFNVLDKDRKGYITINDLRRFFKEKNERIDERFLHDLLSEVDLNKNGAVDLMEFLQLVSGLKGGTITQNRLVRYLDIGDLQTPSVARTGGGL